MSHRHRHRRNGTYTTVSQYINVHRPTSRCPTDTHTDGMAPTQWPTVNQYINVHRPTSRCPTDADTDGMAPTQGPTVSQSINISMSILTAAKPKHPIADVFSCVFCYILPTLGV